MKDQQNLGRDDEKSSTSNTVLKIGYGLAVGVMLILIVTIYKSRVLEQYWNIRELKQNQTKWENQQIAHYRMSVDLPYDTTYYGQLPMPLLIEVKDGEVVSVVDAQGETISAEESNESAYFYQNYFTVPGLFSYVHQYYLQKPPAMEISYDPAFGFPSHIFIDPYTEPCCQDFEINVENFQALP